MRARNRSGNVNSHGYAQSPANRDIGVAAMNEFPRRAGGEQNHHSDYPNAKENQYKGSKKLGYEFCEERGLWIHKLPIARLGIRSRRVVYQVTAVALVEFARSRTKSTAAWKRATPDCYSATKV